MSTTVRKLGRLFPLIVLVGTLTAILATRADAGHGIEAVTADGRYAGAPDGVEPILVDEFDGTGLDRTVWGTCHWWAPPEGGCTIKTNDELEWYVDDSVSVSDGSAHLTATDDPITASEGTFPYRSGMISTGPASYEDSVDARFAFTYGYVEARLRLPEGTGLWPAFWLLPAAKESRPEIDIVETLGDTPETARLHYHWIDPAGNKQSIGHDVTIEGSPTDWHTFGVDWRPGRITWVIDGEAVWSVAGPSVSSEPMYVLLNLAVGGEWPGSPDADTEFPASVEVDWLRVWPQR